MHNYRIIEHTEINVVNNIMVADSRMVTTAVVIIIIITYLVFLQIS